MQRASCCGICCIGRGRGSTSSPADDTRSTCRRCELFRSPGMPVTAGRSVAEQARRRAAAHADQIVFEGFEPAECLTTRSPRAMHRRRRGHPGSEIVERACAFDRRASRTTRSSITPSFWRSKQSGCATPAHRLAAAAHLLLRRWTGAAGRADAAVSESRTRRANMSSTMAGPMPSSAPAAATTPSCSARSRSPR